LSLPPPPPLVIARNGATSTQDIQEPLACGNLTPAFRSPRNLPVRGQRVQSLLRSSE